MKNIKIGVIGCGVRGAHHVGGLNGYRGTTVAALADPVRERLEKLAGGVGSPEIYTDGMELIEKSDVDAITLALPACARAEPALAALRAGRHLLIEKPVAMNAEEVKCMIAARGDLVAGCCSSRHTFPTPAEIARQKIADGAIGNIRSIHARYMMPLRGPDPLPPAWRLKRSANGGGILMNWGCYDLDYLMHITEWRLAPETVLAQVWPIPEMYLNRVVPGSDAETHFTMLIRCAGGETIHLERAEYTTTIPSAVCEIIGDRGSLRLDMSATSEEGTILHTAHPRDNVSSETICPPEDADAAASNAVAVYHDFIDAIIDKRPCRTPLERALLIQQISEAVYSSAQTGEAVRVR